MFYRGLYGSVTLSASIVLDESSTIIDQHQTAKETLANAMSNGHTGLFRTLRSLLTLFPFFGWMTFFVCGSISLTLPLLVTLTRALWIVVTSSASLGGDCGSFSKCTSLADTETRTSVQGHVTTHDVTACGVTHTRGLLLVISRQHGVASFT